MQEVQPKKGLIVTNAYEVFPSVLHFIERMKEAFGPLGVALDTISAAELNLSLNEKGAIQTPALAYDFVLYLDKDRYVANMLEQQGLRLFNSAKAIELCDDKMLTYLTLANQGIAMPKTLSAPLRYSKKNNDIFLKNVAKSLSFPLVAKENFGSMGMNVSLINDEEELRKTEDRLAYLPHLYQEFIASSKGRDHRLILVDGKYLCGYERRSKTSDFRSNLAISGEGVPAEIIKEEIAMAEKAIALLGLDYAGVDLLIGPDGKPILCEVNSNAFFQGAESITKVDVASAYAQHIFDEIYK